MRNVGDEHVVGNGLFEVRLMSNQFLHFLRRKTYKVDGWRRGEDAVMESLELLSTHLGGVLEAVEGPTNQVDAVPEDDTAEIAFVHHLSGRGATDNAYNVAK